MTTPYIDIRCPHERKEAGHNTMNTDTKTDGRIFSGLNSELMWKYINAHRITQNTRRDDTFEALYSLGCRCQELEAVVRRQGERIEHLGNALQRLTEVESK